MTIKQFRDNEALRTKLAMLLDDSTLKMALEAVEEEAKPRGFPEHRPGAPLDTLYAHAFHRKAGIQSAIDVLKRMTTPNPTEEQDEEDRPFWHNLPPELRKTMREAQANQQL